MTFFLDVFVIPRKITFIIIKVNKVLQLTYTIKIPKYSCLFYVEITKDKMYDITNVTIKLKNTISV